MYQIDVITIFPEFITSLFDCGVLRRGLSAQIIELRTWNPRNYGLGRNKKIDDAPYGGGPGMVMLHEPLSVAIDAAKQKQPDTPVIYLSPQGQPFNQKVARDFATRTGMILVSGRYEGVDKRTIDAHIDEEWSIGDYVLTGGELAVAVVIDSVCRMLPGILGDEESVKQDTFSTDLSNLLKYPQYTRPASVDGMAVPDVLLSGNHQEIRRWRLKQALGNTWIRRPDLIDLLNLDKEQRTLLQEFILEHRED